MVDKIEMEVHSYENIKRCYPAWNRFPIMKELISRGKHPQLLHMDLLFDTSTATTLSETAAPLTSAGNGQVYNFAVPQQVYLRSSAAADTAKDIDVVGQKADGTFGQFTFSTDDTDGETPVDIGTWKFMSAIVENDTFTGNAIFDDDGASTTVYFTALLGVSPKLAILVVPDGYCFAVVQADSRALVEITTVNTMAIAVDHVVAATLNIYNPITQFINPAPAHEGEGKINIRSAFYTAAFSTKSHCLIAIWEE